MGLLTPSFAAGLTMVMARLLSRLRGGRTQPRVRLGDRPWFPIAVFAVILIGLRPILADDPSAIGKFILYDWIGSLALAAVLGSTPRDAGEWLIRLVRRWERWREGQRGTPLRRWGTALALAAGLVAISWLPAVTGDLWPSSGPESAGEQPPLVAVAKSRAAMLDGRSDQACELMQIPSGEGIAACREWAPIAVAWLRHDVDAHAAPMTPDDLGGFNISFDDGSEAYGSATWSVWTADDSRDPVGQLVREDESGRVWSVVLSRRAPAGDPLSVQRSYWEYEVVNRAGRWVVTYVGVCSSTGAEHCIRLSQLQRPELERAARQEPAGGDPGPSAG